MVHSVAERSHFLAPTFNSLTAKVFFFSLKPTALNTKWQTEMEIFFWPSVFGRFDPRKVEKISITPRNRFFNPSLFLKSLPCCFLAKSLLVFKTEIKEPTVQDSLPSSPILCQVLSDEQLRLPSFKFIGLGSAGQYYFHLNVLISNTFILASSQVRLHVAWTQGDYSHSGIPGIESGSSCYYTSDHFDLLEPSSSWSTC